MKNAQELESHAVQNAVALMAAAARTAPKTRGIDNVRVVAIDDAGALGKLIVRMREIAQAENRPGFERDAKNVSVSAAVLAIGVESNAAGLNCGFCGHDACDELKSSNGICSFNSIDLGIASGSAVAVAANLHIDNRIMYSVGRACVDLGWLGPNVKQALGIPLSATGKSPFFDRKG
jgi:uncharacterized ferredoxin-like protein